LGAKKYLPCIPLLLVHALLKTIIYGSYYRPAFRLFKALIEGGNDVHFIDHVNGQSSCYLPFLCLLFIKLSIKGYAPGKNVNKPFIFRQLLFLLWIYIYLENIKKAACGPTPARGSPL
jgi:hypothetical protein